MVGSGMVTPVANFVITMAAPMFSPGVTGSGGGGSRGRRVRSIGLPLKSCVQSGHPGGGPVILGVLVVDVVAGKAAPGRHVGIHFFLRRRVW